MLTSPVPSGNNSEKSTLKKSKSGSKLVQLYEQAKDSYDEIILTQATTPYGMRNPQTLEVLTRHRCTELESKLAESNQELQQLWQEKDEIHAELDQVRNTEIEVRQENEKLRSVNDELNRTLQDYKFSHSHDHFSIDGGAGDRTLEEMNFEREQLAAMRDAIFKQKSQISYNESVMKCMQAEYNSHQEDSQAQVNNLQFQLNEAVAELDECEQKINAQLDLNQTISEEKLEYEKLAESYKLKLETYQTDVAKIRAENVLKTSEIQLRMDRMADEIAAGAKNLAFWREHSERKTNELSIMSRKLNSERAQRESTTKLYRSQSIQNKVLKNKADKMKGEVQDLERELATSRMQVRQLEHRFKDKSKLRKFADIVACGSKNASKMPYE